MPFHRDISRATLIVTGATSILWGCGVLAGITDFTMVDPDASSTRLTDPPTADADALADGSDRLDAAGDDAAVDADASDARADVAPCKGPEVCGDGVDNDCNGKVDCADPACTSAGFACVNAPAGWSVVTFAQGSHPACPAGYPGAVPLHDVPDPAGLPGTGVCGCACGTTSDNPCVVGNIQTRFKESTNCSAGTGSPLVSDGGCNPIPPNMIPNQCGASGTCMAVATGAITGKSIACGAGTTTLPPVAPTSPGSQACINVLAPTGADAGCTTGATCAAPALGLQRCVAHDGNVACPVDFPTQTVLYIDGTEADNRSCGVCACATGPVSCTLPKLTLFDESACATQISSAVIGSGQCQPLTSGVDASTGYFQISASPTTTPTCQVAGGQPAVQGTYSPGSALTICCP